MMHGAVHPGLREGWWASDALLETPRKRTCLVIHVPVEGRGELETLCRFQAKAVHIADEDKKAGELLAPRDDAEFSALLDGVDCIAAGVRQADDFRLRGLRLQKIR